MAFTLQKYVLASGRIPFDVWLASLSPVIRARVYANLARLEAGNLGNVKPLADADGVLELRMFFGPGYRAYLGRDGASLVILLCGGDKDSQTRDVARAKSFWHDYKTRKAADNGSNG